MTPDQVKAARLLLGWSMSRLGMRSGTSMHTVRIFERSGQVAKLYCRTDQVDAVAAIRDTLEAAGIEFIPEAGPVTPDQLKAARALLRWSLDRAGARSGTSAQLVSTFEKTGRIMSMNAPGRPVQIDAVATVRSTLEAVGVEFTDGDQPGVKLRKPEP